MGSCLSTGENLAQCYLTEANWTLVEKFENFAATQVCTLLGFG